MDTLEKVFKIIVYGALAVGIILLTIFGIIRLQQKPEVETIVETEVVEVEVTSAKAEACWQISGLMGSNDTCVMPEVCAVCEECPQPEVIVQPTTPDTSSSCVAEIVGIPVTEAGSCSYCTVNYLYDPTGQNPGDVIIAGEEPVEYQEGAYVYQYQKIGFRACIAAQPFMVDPGYRPVFWTPSEN